MSRCALITGASSGIGYELAQLLAQDGYRLVLVARNELEGTGVTVTALCPGPTRTSFQERAGVGDTPLMRGRIAGAASVAREGFRGLMAGTTVVIPGMRNRLLAFAVKCLPRPLVIQAARKIQEKRQPS